MILGDSDIRTYLRLGLIQVDPEPQDQAIQPASLELHIDGGVYLEPGEFKLGHTIEVVTLGTQVAAHLSGKSSLGRLGLDIHATAGWIDPGFSGQIVLELYNKSRHDIMLNDCQAVGQLVFHMLRSPAQRPYGHPDLRSHYQNQRGDTESHLEYPCY